MSVRVGLLGRLGNNLFSYALGRIIAEKLNFALECYQIPIVGPSLGGVSLDVGQNATLVSLAQYFPEAPLFIPGRVFRRPVQKFELRPGLDWSGQTIDLHQVLQEFSPRQVRLKGWFQRFEYYVGYRSKLRQWFLPQPQPALPAVSPRDILVNIRRGADFGLRGWVIPVSYYINVLETLADIGNVFICGTDISNELVRRFKAFHPIYFHGSPLEHFVFITKFKRIILSNSTFAWWAAFLSEAEQIFAPRAVNIPLFSFTGFEDVDLHMREKRYIEVPVREGVRFVLFEKSGMARITGVNHTNGKVRITIRERPEPVVLDASLGRLLEWLIDLEGPFTLSDLRQHCEPGTLEPSLHQLLISRLIDIHPQYVDC